VTIFTTLTIKSITLCIADMAIDVSLSPVINYYYSIIITEGFAVIQMTRLFAVSILFETSTGWPKKKATTEVGHA